jgi:hypothetical protein
LWNQQKAITAMLTMMVISCGDLRRSCTVYEPQLHHGKNILHNCF